MATEPIIFSNPFAFAQITITPDKNVLSIESINPTLRKINPDTGATISSVEISLAGEEVNGGTGIAFNPVDGKLYALLKVGGSDRLLATIDPATGLASEVGNTGGKLASLTFNPGTLYSVDLDSGNLTTISTANGSVTNLCALDTFGGTGLSFNPNDGLLYYTTSGEFQRIDDFTVDPCDVTELSTDPSNPTALVFFNSFLIVDFQDELSSITDAGVDTFIGDLDHFSRGLTIIDKTDADGDGVLDADDNCPNTPNAGQEDHDADGTGDVCDPNTEITTNTVAIDTTFGGDLTVDGASFTIPFGITVEFDFENQKIIIKNPGGKILIQFGGKIT